MRKLSPDRGLREILRREGVSGFSFNYVAVETGVEKERALRYDRTVQHRVT